MGPQLEKRMLRTVSLSGAALVLASAALIVLLCLRGGDAPGPVVGGREGWTVTRGAPAQTGTETRVPRSALLQGTLLLVSPEHPLPADAPAPNTRAIRALVGGYLPAESDTALCREAVYALCEMQLERPLTAVRFTRGTLSPAQQEDWRREALGRYLAVAPLAEALRLALAAVPGAGESEHQTGWALDVTLTGTLQMGRADPLLRNETGQWLADEMWRFGWIRRYAPGDAAGGCEGVHLRYVGRAHAAAMHALGLGLEEYWALLRAEGALTIRRDNADYAYLYCAPCAGDWTLRLPENAAYTASLDNTGWAVAAVAAGGAF